MSSQRDSSPDTCPVCHGQAFIREPYGDPVCVSCWERLDGSGGDEQ